jgi:hypothetical protein
VREEVTFELFERWLWPHMVAKAKPEAARGGHSVAELKRQAAALRTAKGGRRAGTEPSIVFREIVSFIKGSSEALDSADGYLSRAEYLGLGSKMAPTFTKAEVDDDTSRGGRAEAYDLFLRYEAWKAAYNAYDVMDAVRHIFCQLRLGGYQGPRIDEVYTDEVQDFTQAELRLFIEVCHDKNGLFFTGDTCQTIARGVGFRFEELTTMFHHVRAKQLSELAAAGRQLDDLPRHKRVRVPEINKLAVNYRTHNGILGAASEVVSLLLQLFPHSVDALEKDRGHFDGPKPVLLRDTTTDDLAMMLMGSDPAHSQI